jgi:hypothetical protein
MIRLFIGALTVTVMFAGCGSSKPQAVTVTVSSTGASGATVATTTIATPTEKPDAFLKRLLDYDFKGQWNRSWAMLHPGQQRFVDREKFADCNTDSFPGAELVSVKTIEVYEDPLDVPGVPQKNSKAVTLKITMRAGSTEDSITQTFHAVPVGDRWAWVLGASDAAAFKAGECPT